MARQTIVEQIISDERIKETIVQNFIKAINEFDFKKEVQYLVDGITDNFWDDEDMWKVACESMRDNLKAKLDSVFKTI